MIESFALVRRLSARRKELGMPVDVLARLSGKSSSTIERVLGGSTSAEFDTVLAIARALGVQIGEIGTIDADKILEARAKQKAEKLVGYVQSTSALEGQGISADLFGSMVNRTVHQLMAGSKRRLWD